ncbi:MAG: type II toxin-antitoxin system RelE/ParE family toxin [Nitrospirae bacterium]|nr:type II toxin-antitoxin system RelE/ParE family toxin [Nitrospirota bacterium]
MSRTITFYKTSAGKCPIHAQKVTWVLKLIEDLDIVPSSYFKKLTGTEDIWEYRITFGSNAYRIFCFIAENSVVVLTHGFTKKSQKTPKKEIERAEAYRKDFLERGTKQ